MKQWEARMQKHRKEAEEEETRKAKGKKAFRKWCEKDKKRAEIEERVWARRVRRLGRWMRVPEEQKRERERERDRERDRERATQWAADEPRGKKAEQETMMIRTGLISGSLLL